MLKGMMFSSICPAISVELAKHGYSQVIEKYLLVFEENVLFVGILWLGRL